MAENFRRYQINDILNGYNDYDKLPKIYKEVKEILPETPIQFSDEPFFIRGNGSGDVNGNYGWELYQTEGGIFMLEFYGRWGGYAGGNRPHDTPEQRGLYHLTLTLHPPQPDLEKRIEKVLAKYPEKAKEKAVTPQ